MKWMKWMKGMKGMKGMVVNNEVNENNFPMDDHAGDRHANKESQEINGEIDTQTKK